ncbi:MAG TPA: 5-keto-L-gluconate epimerase [bacterium]|nr:5-keto-L-gluconate epimerase [bacterium]
MKLALVISIDETSFDAVAVRGSWADGVRMAANLGYEGVELAIRDPRTVDARAIERTLRDSGLVTPAIGTGQAFLKEGLSLSDPDEGIRARAIERMETHIHLAARFGAAVIIGLLRGRISGNRAATASRLDASLHTLLPVAEREKVSILFEPINRYETDLLARVEDVLAVVDRMGSPALGVLADTFHMNIEEASIEQALRLAGQRLRLVHAADSNRWAPGWGHLDFPSIVRTLREIGYGGFLSAEILPQPDPPAAAQQTIAHLRPLIGTAAHHKGGYA